VAGAFIFLIGPYRNIKIELSHKPAEVCKAFTPIIDNGLTDIGCSLAR